jgi:hypothetical protein
MSREQAHSQGGQIGPILAQWVTLGSFLTCRSSPHFLAILFHGEVTYALPAYNKNVLGYILGDYFHKLLWSHYVTQGMIWCIFSFVAGKMAFL